MGGAAAQQRQEERSGGERHVAVSQYLRMAGDDTRARAAALRQRPGGGLRAHVAAAAAAEAARAPGGEGEGRSTTARVGHCYFQTRAQIRQPSVRTHIIAMPPVTMHSRVSRSRLRKCTEQGA